MIATAAGIVREEGAMKLWQGVTPALYRHLVYRYDLRKIQKNLTKNLARDVMTQFRSVLI